MTCGGCARSVVLAIKAVKPDATVEVNLAAGTVNVEGLDEDTVVAKAVQDAGFDFDGRA